MRTALKGVLAGFALIAALPSAMAQQAADPARVAAARPVVDKIFPAGTYKRMMGGALSKMMDGMLGGVMHMPIAELARMSGIPASKLTGVSQASLEQVSAIVDPHFRERTKLGMDAMMAQMGELMNGFEPRVRDALTRAYARKFDTRELGEINAFFATPTGSRFASEYMAMSTDPDVLAEMQALMPEMMKKLPDMAQKANAATSKLPPPRKYSGLSQTEKDKLAQLLGMKASDLDESATQAEEGSK